MRPACIQYLRPDKLAVICCLCEDKLAGDQWAVDNGYDATHTFCPKCLDKYKMDSLKDKNKVYR
jgi:hypothetical protein